MLNKGDDLSPKTLCKSCHNGTFIKYDDNTFMTYCSYFGRTIPKPVIDCTTFEDKHYPNPDTLKKIAWEIDISQLTKQKIGFYKPGDPKRTVRPFDDL